jgi:hypothetical protein
MRKAGKILRKTGLDIISERITARKAEENGQDYVKEKRAIEKEGRDLLDLFMDIDLGEYLMDILYVSISLTPSLAQTSTTSTTRR